MLQNWEAIRAEVLRRIRAREWPPGALIPGEQALAAEFGCARGTVNRALRHLAEAGVLERRRKSGTRVALLPVRRATLSIPVTRTEVEARGQAHSHLLLASQLGYPPTAIAARLGMAGKMLYLETLHLADGRPFVHETRWLNSAVLRGPLPDFSLITANEWLVSNVAYATGDISFFAEGASAREADVLGVPEGEALFIAERATWTADDPVTHVRLAHAPGYRMQTQV